MRKRAEKPLQNAAPVGVAGEKSAVSAPLMRSQVAERLGISVSTVRRYEGDRLHPQIGAGGVRLFDAAEVAELATELVTPSRVRRFRNAAGAAAAKPVARSAEEVAALVFERFEQRQSLAEIVMGVRVTPERVRELYEQWCRGLVEGQLRETGEVIAPRVRDHVRIEQAELAARLAALPEELTRISVARYRGEFTAPTPAGEDEEFANVLELGGFYVSGPCALSEITDRYGKGDYRVTAYGFNPSGLRWEVITAGVRAPGARPVKRTDEIEDVDEAEDLDEDEDLEDNEDEDLEDEEAEDFDEATRQPGSERAAPPPHAARSEETTANLATSGDEPPQEQWPQMVAVRAYLSPREAAIAEALVVHMSPAMRVQWLAELSTRSPQQAAELVRSMIPKRAPAIALPSPSAITASTEPGAAEPSAGAAVGKCSLKCAPIALMPNASSNAEGERGGGT